VLFLKKHRRKRGELMEWTTHALSGLVAGYLVTNDWRGAAVGAVASIIPDLDEPKSKFGKPFFFISIPLNKLLGHRTLTHSLLFIILASTIFYPFSPLVALATMAGIAVHIAGDMLTGRVQLLYPLPRRLGIKVSRFNYVAIDLFTRIALSVIVVWGFWKEIF
jgi:inner membrane protein